jgi:hypothetical protein
MSPGQPAAPRPEPGPEASRLDPVEQAKEVWEGQVVDLDDHASPAFHPSLYPIDLRGRRRGSGRRVCVAGCHVLYGRVGSGEEEPFVPVRPAHYVRRRSVGSSYLDDLALTAPLAHVLTANVDAVP